MVGIRYSGKKNRILDFIKLPKDETNIKYKIIQRNKLITNITSTGHYYNL